MLEATSPITTAQLRDVAAALGRLDVDAPDGELVDRIRALEEVKAAAAAAQARITTAFVEAQQAVVAVR